MKKILGTFFPLYTATLLMLLGSGLLTTYVSLLLVADNVSGAMIGALTTAQYLGLVIGGSVGHFLIARVGHIRTYVACAGIITAAVLMHGLVVVLPVWIFLRLVIGLCLMCQYMVLESWLNDQAESNQRGTVFGFYMAASYLGIALGQLALMLYSDLGSSALMMVALFFALCLVPIALTTRTQVQRMTPAPLTPVYFIRRIPKALISTLLTGMIVGSFYGLAPVYASLQNLTTQQTSLFMALAIFAGLIAQWPLGWLSDRYNRAKLMQVVAAILAVISVILALLQHVSFIWLLILGFSASFLQFSLYPLVVALANDQIEAEHRVSLAACLLMAFGIGASISPVLVGSIMQPLGSNMLYAVFALCSIAIVWLNYNSAKAVVHMAQDAPIPHVPMPDSLASSSLSTALDPRVNEQIIQDVMHNDDLASESAPMDDGNPPVLQEKATEDKGN